MDKIMFTDYELGKLQKASGLSPLELNGLVALMNEILIPKIKSAKAYARSEALGEDY